MSNVKEVFPDSMVVGEVYQDIGDDLINPGVEPVVMKLILKTKDTLYFEQISGPNLYQTSRNGSIMFSNKPDNLFYQQIKTEK